MAVSPKRLDSTSSTEEPAVNPLPRILIVEDNLRYAFELMRALKEPDLSVYFDVQVAPSIEEALPYLNDDSIDIYIVDVKFGDNEPEGEEAGRAFVAQILQKTNAGVIVHSTLHERTEAARFMMLGADDYLEKGKGLDLTRAKVLALWRRVALTRPNFSKSYQHANRVFKLGNWRFEVGSRVLTDSNGNKVRVSPTEHALLRYLCTVEDNEIDRESFNVSVLGRPAYESDKRIDNLIYRLRTKLGDDLQIVPLGDGRHKLLNIKELRAQK